MVLTTEQENKIKGQLIEHIENSFPEDKKEFAKSQINSMNSEQLEIFLEKNNLNVKSGELEAGEEGVGTSNCIFCSIASGNVNSYKIGEEKEVMAVLEINPLSKGHTIIIPKDHIPSTDEVPESAFSLGKKVSKKIKEKLNPKKVEISSANIFGHEIINIVPVYEGDSQKEKVPAKPEELEKLREELEIKKEVLIKKEPEKIILNSDKIWLPKRIP